MQKPSVTRRKIPLRSRRRRGTRTIRTPCCRSHQYWQSSRASRRMQSGLQQERPRGQQNTNTKANGKPAVSRRRRRRARLDLDLGLDSDCRRAEEADTNRRRGKSVDNLLHECTSTSCRQLQRIRVKHVCYYSRFRQIILPIRQILRKAVGSF